ncbi:MAG: polyketide synthase dehydratase domain-containing protein, partial [Chthoniobacterales bacterium]
MRRAMPGRETMLSSLGALCVAGYRASWGAIYPRARKTPLPFYPWRLESPWTELPTCRAGRFGDREHPLLGHASIDAPGVWNGRASVDLQPWLADHCVNGQPVFPGAAYVELAFAAARARGMNMPLAIEHLDFVKALSLDRGGRPTVLRFSLGLDNSSFEISAAGDQDSPFVLQARGRLAPAPAMEKANTKPEALFASLTAKCTGEELRENLRRRGLELGAAFTGLCEVRWREGEAISRIEMTEQVAPDEDNYVFHPAFLDACFGTLACTVPGWRDAMARKLFLPVTFDRVRLHRRPAGKLWAHAHLTQAESHLVAGNLSVTDDEGQPVIEFEGFRARAIATAESAELLASALYRERWEEVTVPPIEPEALQGKKVLLLAENSHAASAILVQLQKAGAKVRQLPSFSSGEESGDLVVDARALAPSSRADQAAPAHHAAQALEVLREIAVRAAEKKPLPRLVFLTSQARHALPGNTIEPAKTSVCGLVRTARIEMPGLDARIVDFDSSDPTPESVLTE